jgi:hypothetical protein
MRKAAIEADAAEPEKEKSMKGERRRRRIWRLIITI